VTPIRVKALLTDLPDVRQVTELQVEHGPEHHHRLRVSREAGQEIGGAIAAAIVHAGLELHELQRHRATMEDVFLNLTTTEPDASRRSGSSSRKYSTVEEEEAPAVEKPVEGYCDRRILTIFDADSQEETPVL
jgi:hypothetical protein